MSASGAPWRGRWLSAGWLLAAVAPVATAVALVRSSWTPVIDNALIAALAVDSLSLDPPLVGMPTSLGVEDGTPLSHVGPLGLWLLAIPTRVMGAPGHGLIVGSVVLALASLAALAFLLRRWGDPVLEAVALVMVAVMMACLVGGTFVSPLNPHIGVLPLVVCLFATGGVLAGHHRQLWAVVLAGSLAAQTHLGYVLLVAALVALTAAGLLVDVIRSSGAARRRLTHRTIPVGVLLGLVAWTGPILDQLFGTRNLSRLVGNQSAGAATPAGADHGFDVTVEMTSLPPRWMLGRARDQSLADPGAIRVALSLAALASVAALLAWALRRRDRALASLAAVSLVGVGTAALSTARMVDPEGSPYLRAEDILMYRLLWWPVGAVFATTLVWGALRVVAATQGRRWADRDLRRLQAPALACLVAGLAALVPVGYTTAENPLLDRYFERESVNAAAIADLPGSPSTVVLRFRPAGADPAPPPEPVGVWDTGPDRVYGFAINLVAQLRLRGITVRFADEPSDGVTFTLAYRDDHRASGDEPVELLYLAGAQVHAEPPPGYRRISFSGAVPGEPVDVTTIPTGVFVRA